MSGDIGSSRDRDERGAHLQLHALVDAFAGVLDGGGLADPPEGPVGQPLLLQTLIVTLYITHARRGGFSDSDVSHAKEGEDSVSRRHSEIPHTQNWINIETQAWQISFIPLTTAFITE